MAWYIASIPFWFVGLFFLYAAPNSIICRRPDETVASLAAQFFVSLLISGIFLLIAAKVVS